MHAYAAPRSPVTNATGHEVAARLRKRAWISLVASFGLLVGGIALGGVIDARDSTALIALASSALGVLGAVFGVVALVKGGTAVGAKGTVGSVFAVLLNLMMTGVGLLTALLATMSLSRGRQLRSFGRVLLPPVTTGDDWAKPSDQRAPGFELDEATRLALAAQWRENGRTEHASVAAFARLTLDLVALGAPPALVRSANEDAIEEIRHAELCFAVARSIDGRAESPGAFPQASRARTLVGPRTAQLAQLAVDSLVDGALHEGVSARIVAKLARRTADPAVREMLKEIAADEGRHARHGWDVVKFCLSEGGEPVAYALEAAGRALPKTMRTPLPDAARSGAWERFGIMSEALEATEFEATRRDLEVRLASLLAPYLAVAA
ncbi:hypothetical protein AKJ09_09542 [Labilithrix luteola]|uniref:Uncharacterized protein n=1 Tax=Labilithrix luteola TaxID=1391654 RepID=A0A0K1QAW5_9BACT|nr:hypothetical protein AKJ09_09542 [Labilithrix luteola]